MATLLEIGDELQALDELLETMGGDVSNPEVEKMIDAYLTDLTRDRDVKLDSYAAFIRELELRAQVRRTEAKRLTERVRIDQNLAEALNNRLKWFFTSQGLKTVDTARFKLTLQGNGGLQPLRLLVSPEELPEQYREETITYKPKTDEIRAALAAKDETVSTFAVLEPRGSSIRIR